LERGVRCAVNRKNSPRGGLSDAGFAFERVGVNRQLSAAARLDHVRNCIVVGYKFSANRSYAVLRWRGGLGVTMRAFES